MMTFIMSEPPKTRVRGAASSPALPPLALEALAGSGLANVVERAKWLATLDPLLRQSLPATLAGQCKLANVDDKHLVFLVSAPVWKAKLRLHADALLDAAAAAGLRGRSLVVKVSAPVLPVPTGTGTARPLSEAVRDSLRATAQSVSDPELRAQLLRLASSSRSGTDGA
ncbi:DciA family protein [Arenimonas metalli]|nr:DciA family protein [Arenimonas metalli]